MNGMGSNQDTSHILDNHDRRRDNAPQKHHSFLAQDRHTMTVHGVTDVVSFDENGVFLVTTCGQLNLEGSELHVNILNTEEGIVEVTGKLNGLLYYDTPEKASDNGRRKTKRLGHFFS